MRVIGSLVNGPCLVSSKIKEKNASEAYHQFTTFSNSSVFFSLVACLLNHKTSPLL
jgi:hypothetical protein